LEKRWICAFAEYSNRFFIAAGYHSIRLVDTQATPPKKNSPLITKDYPLKCGQIFNIKKTQFKTAEYMLMTRDGLHFVEVSKDNTTTKDTFRVTSIDLSRSIMPGKEIREAIEYERDSYIVCGYDEKVIHFVTRNKVPPNPIDKSQKTPEIVPPYTVVTVANPSGGEYYRNLMRWSTYHALRMPYVFMRDDKAISIINTVEKSIKVICYCSFDYWAPLTMEVSGLGDPAGLPTPVIIHALE
jgi:hypothetical protein